MTSTEATNSQANSDPTASDGGLQRNVSLITSTSLPSTGVIVTLVVAGTLGADQVTALFGGSNLQVEMVLFCLLLSIFVTMNAAMPLLWRFCLLPVNFCVLVYLATSSYAVIVASTTHRQSAGEPAGSTYVEQSRMLPATTPTGPASQLAAEGGR